MMKSCHALLIAAAVLGPSAALAGQPVELGTFVGRSMLRQGSLGKNAAFKFKNGKLDFGNARARAWAATPPRTEAAREALSELEGALNEELASKEGQAAMAEELRSRVSLRLDGGDLVVEKHSGADVEQPMSATAWRQRFQVTSDKTLEDGTRLIEYRRPDRASAAAKQNLKDHNRVAPLPFLKATRLQGFGRVTIKGDKLEWDNLGVGLLGDKLTGRILRAPFAWKERMEATRVEN
jgi:hypothetical protein